MLDPRPGGSMAVAECTEAARFKDILISQHLRSIDNCSCYRVQVLGKSRACKGRAAVAADRVRRARSELKIDTTQNESMRCNKITCEVSFRALCFLPSTTHPI